jgi:hypothetical protein
VQGKGRIQRAVIHREETHIESRYTYMEKKHKERVEICTYMVKKHKERYAEKRERETNKQTNKQTEAEK